VRAGRLLAHFTAKKKKNPKKKKTIKKLGLSVRELVDQGGTLGV